MHCRGWQEGVCLFQTPEAEVDAGYLLLAAGREETHDDLWQDTDGLRGQGPCVSADENGPTVRQTEPQAVTGRSLFFHDTKEGPCALMATAPLPELGRKG